MSFDTEHYYAVQSFLEDDELHKIWNIIEIAMNRDYMANMLFNINDVVETLQGHSINDDIIEEYDKSQFDEEPKTHMDIPKDWEGSSFTIGDCLLDLQTHINELHDYFYNHLFPSYCQRGHQLWYHSPYLLEWHTTL